ncbi:MAG: transposase [Ignavibacteriae bacterium]|nr:MAG: transposase [Ignavibacteriota bacterium]
MYLDDMFYHIYNRGAHRSNIYNSAFQFNYFLKLLERYRVNYKIEISAYCLMPNHYHFLLKQKKDGSISRFIQTLCNAYVQAFNNIENHSGTIFQGAVKGIAVVSDEHLIQLISYIHNNPVAAGLVNKPELWKYSDYGEWIGIKQFRFDGKALRDMYFSSTDEYVDLMKVHQENNNCRNYLLDS